MKKLQILTAALLIVAGCAWSGNTVLAETPRHFNLLPAESLASIAGIRVEYGYGDLPDRQLSHDDFAALSRCLSGAEYDSARNDSGAMINPVTADYTLMVNYDPVARREDDVISVWNDGMRAHFRGKWYLLQPDTSAELEQILSGAGHHARPATR
ncbi:MAG: hypothetical protein LUE26_03460 [Alistipes sp.]|nr:hypothetical protein [Alistipes sp.]